MREVTIKNTVIGRGMPKICIPLMGSTDDELLTGARKILEQAKTYSISIVEFRADFYGNLSNLQALKSIMEKLRQLLADVVFLFTIRSEREGGESLPFLHPGINEINYFVIENKLADMVDVELFSDEEEIQKLVSAAKKNQVKVIMSNHEFATTPDAEVMVERLCNMQSLGADIVKIAVMPENMEHVADTLKAAAIMKEHHNETPVVVISMGKSGAVSRIVGEIFGSAITFAAIKDASAPGQLSVKDANEILEYLHRCL